MHLIDLKMEKEALELLKNININYNKIDGFGYTALFRSILANMDELSSELLKKKDIDYNLKDFFWKHDINIFNIRKYEKNIIRVIKK